MAAFDVNIAIMALSPAINAPTTAARTIDQLEDFLRRLGSVELDAGSAVDEGGALRLVFPTPTWEDYLTLAFDEIRQFGSSSVQMLRRMRSALVGLFGLVAEPRTRGGGATIPRPCHRGLAVRPRGPADGAPGRPAGYRPVPPPYRRGLSLIDCWTPLDAMRRSRWAPPIAGWGGNGPLFRRSAPSGFSPVRRSWRRS